MSRDPLEYVLNRMEAARDVAPPTTGYLPARKELLDGIAALRAEVERLTEQAQTALDSLNGVSFERDALAARMRLVEFQSSLDGTTELVARVATLEAAIRDAPHSATCGWWAHGMRPPCDCWKAAALEGK